MQPYDTYLHEVIKSKIADVQKMRLSDSQMDQIMRREEEKGRVFFEEMKSALESNSLEWFVSHRVDLRGQLNPYREWLEVAVGERIGYGAAGVDTWISNRFGCKVGFGVSPEKKVYLRGKTAFNRNEYGKKMACKKVLDYTIGKQRMRMAGSEAVDYLISNGYVADAPYMRGKSLCVKVRKGSDCVVLHGKHIVNLFLDTYEKILKKG